jgi:hypothetical protein
MDPDDEFAMITGQVSRRFALLVRVATRTVALTVAPLRRQHALAVGCDRILALAVDRGLPVGIPPAWTGRPRGMDYGALSVLLAAGASQSEAATSLRVTRSAVSKAWTRNRTLRSSVNRLAHAAYGMTGMED